MRKHIILAVISTLFYNTYAISNQIEQANKLLSTLTIDDTQSELADAPKKAIYPKQKNKAIALLREQLDMLDIDNMNGYDQALSDFIKQYQNESSYLAATGILDLSTWYSIYNQSDKWKKSVIERSIEEWTNIYNTELERNSEKFIVVNLPSMTLHAYQWIEGYPVEQIQSRVVIGSTKYNTPLTNFDIWGIKYNPTWTPTDNIVNRNLYKNDTLNTKWITSHHLKAFDSNNTYIPHEDLQPGVKYRFQQPASEFNALGVLKFETSSKNNIYLHDTNEKHYFDSNFRAHSSGCIRVQQFKDLAVFISDNSEEYIDIKIKAKKTSTEKIKNIPVYFSYSQIWFDEENPNYFPDVYSKLNNTQLY